MDEKTKIHLRVLPYLADLGTVAFVAAASVIVIGAAAELVSPGLVFNLVAPQGLIAAAVVAGALSLLTEKPDRRVQAKAVYAAIALAASAGVASAAWGYFEALPGDRVVVTLAAGGTAILIFLAAARAARENGA